MFAWSALVLFARGADAVTLPELIENNAEAMGGIKAIEAVKSIAVDLHIVDPDFVADGTYYAARPGRMRIDIMADGKLAYVEAFDGERAWQRKGQGEIVAESGQGTATLRHGAKRPGHLYGLHEVARDHQVELVGWGKHAAHLLDLEA